MIDDSINRARAERDTIGMVPTVVEIKPPPGALANRRESEAWIDLVNARVAFDQGHGSRAILEVAIDRYRAAARGCEAKGAR